MVDIMSPEVRRTILAARAAMRDEAMVVVSGQVQPEPRVNHTSTPLGNSSMIEGNYRPWGKTFLRRVNCPRPLSIDCETLTITGRWAAACFLPSYVRQRKINGADFDAIVRGIATAEPLHCKPQSIAPTQASIELVRRIQLATAVLMRQEGFSAPMPPTPPYQRPPDVTRIRQLWMRALLTGWI